MSEDRNPNIKTIIRPEVGVKGSMLFSGQESSWWPIKAVDDDWKTAGMGSFIPVEMIISGITRLFVVESLPKGTVVLLTAEIVKLP